MSNLSPTGTHVQVATDSAFSNIVLDDDGAYRTSIPIKKYDIPYGVDLYARAAHNHPETGKSAWSPTRYFRGEIPPNIIGVCLDNSNASVKGACYWIDIMGNRLDTFDFHQHPTFANMTIDIADADRGDPVYLLSVPTFYVKTATSGPVNSFANGKKCWWISDKMEPGFRPAACFKRTTTKDSEGKDIIAPRAYLGQFLGHQATVGGKTCVGSRRGMTVLASTTKANFKTYITNRNNPSVGVTGFRMFDIWDMGALRILSLIAKANTDTQTVWGDNAAGTAYPKTGSTNARMCFKGDHTNPEVSFEDAWRCYWYHADLILINSGVVSLYDPRDLTSALSFGSVNKTRYTQATTSGWIRDVLDCPFVLGDDTHDLMELFLPKTVVSSENLGSFSDYSLYDGTYSDSRISFIGSSCIIPFDTSRPNAFALYEWNPQREYAGTIGPWVGSRLSKN